MFSIHQLSFSLGLAFALLAPSTVSASNVFWVPIDDNTTWTFLESGSWADSDGNSGSYGPLEVQYKFSRIDYQIIDHRASLQGSNGWYLMETANGYYTVADKGDPNNNQSYRYYIDPQPFLTKDVREVGQAMHVSGQWRGQLAFPGSGYLPWTGTWDSTVTNLGPESVTTPLGTFQATKFKGEDVDISIADPTYFGRQTWTQYSWFVENVGFVKTSGSGISETDFNGDGVIDRWKSETLTMLAAPVPIPNSLWLLGTGLFALIGASRKKQRR